MAQPAVEIHDVSKRFRIYHERNSTLKGSFIDRRRGRFEEFWAVRDVSAEIAQGESLGIIGENGSGKSTLLKCIAGIMFPERGTISVNGRLASLLEVGAGFHPDFTGRENIYLNGAILGMSRRYIRTILDEIVEFAGLEQFIDNPVKNYSSGMYMRLGFAISVYLDPDVLLIDEVLAVGDDAFQRKCLDRIQRLRSEGRSLIFVSHAMDSVRQVCERCLWMDHGRPRLLSGVDSVIQAYLKEVRRLEQTELEGSATQEIDSSPGVGGLRLTRVEVLGEAGPQNLFNTGDPFSLAIAYEAPAALSGVRFSVTFLRSDGSPVISVPTDDRETGGGLPREGEVQLRLPGLPLLEGFYRLTVDAIEIATGHSLKRLERVRSFRVHSEDHREAGMALLGHSWHLPQPSVSTAAVEGRR
ncbi:MAG: ABC transporter ATP-binding protein [Candidatus Dormibacteria bacterium]